MPTHRDSQRERVYRAQNRVLHHPDVLSPDPVDGIEAARSLFLRLSAYKRFRDTWPRYAEQIFLRRKRVPEVWHITSTTADERGWTWGRWAMKLPVAILEERLLVLHEFSHAIVAGEYGSRPSYHGPEFCGVYLKIAALELGAETRNLLREAFEDGGVTYMR